MSLILTATGCGAPESRKAVSRHAAVWGPERTARVTRRRPDRGPPYAECSPDSVPDLGRYAETATQPGRYGGSRGRTPPAMVEQRRWQTRQPRPRGGGP